jgi:hypothetical protein
VHGLPRDWASGERGGEDGYGVGQSMLTAAINGKGRDLRTPSRYLIATSLNFCKTFSYNTANIYCSLHHVKITVTNSSECTQSNKHNTGF